MIWLSSIICSLDLVQLSLPDGAPIIPSFVRSFADSALSRGGLVNLGRAIFRVVCFCTVATCCVRFALGSYVAVFLALVALLQSALSVVSLALECLALPNEAFINDLVCVFWFSELHDDG